MADESKTGGEHAAGRGARGSAKRLSGGARAFLAFALEHIVSVAESRLRMSCTGQELTKAMLALDSQCEVNLYRKQHGNVAKVLHTGLFDALLRIDGGTLKTVHPLPEFAAVSSLIDEALYTKLTACVTAVQQEKKRRGVKAWERVN